MRNSYFINTVEVIKMETTKAHFIENNFSISDCLTY